jgi:hypothetical protein
MSLPSDARRRGAGVEQFRGLRSHVYQARDQAPLKTILVSSGMPAEGKTFVAANLAMSLARNSINNICSSTPICAVPRCIPCWALPICRDSRSICGEPRS